MRQPGKHRFTREAPVSADLAAGQVAVVGEALDRVLGDLEQVGGFGERQDGRRVGQRGAELDTAWLETEVRPDRIGNELALGGLLLESGAIRRLEAPPRR